MQKGIPLKKKRDKRHENIRQWEQHKVNKDRVAQDQFEELLHRVNQTYMGEYDSEYVNSGDEDCAVVITKNQGVSIQDFLDKNYNVEELSQNRSIRNLELDERAERKLDSRLMQTQNQNRKYVLDRKHQVLKILKKEDKPKSKDTLPFSITQHLVRPSKPQSKEQPGASSSALDEVYEHQKVKFQTKINFLKKSLPKLAAQEDVNLDVAYHAQVTDQQKRDRRKRINDNLLVSSEKQAEFRQEEINRLASSYNINLPFESHKLKLKGYQSTEAFSGDSTFISYKQRKFLVFNEKKMLMAQLKQKQEDEEQREEIKNVLEKELERETSLDPKSAQRNKSLVQQLSPEAFDRSSNEQSQR